MISATSKSFFLLQLTFDSCLFFLQQKFGFGHDGQHGVRGPVGLDAEPFDDTIDFDSFKYPLFFQLFSTVTFI